MTELTELALAASQSGDVLSGHDHALRSKATSMAPHGGHDSGYVSMNSTQSRRLPVGTSNFSQLPPQLTESPAPIDVDLNVPFAKHGRSSIPSLTTSDSASSAGRFSTASHVSIPVTGALPYGSLKIKQQPETPPASNLRKSISMSTSDHLTETDSFVILDLPDKFTVGCDATALTSSTSKFLGIRDIPLGSHFIWVSEPHAFTRAGYWFVTKRGLGEVRVKQWDPYNEVLGEAASQFEVREQKDNISDIYPRLFPYQFPSTDETASLTPPKSLSATTPNSEIEPSAQTGATVWAQLTSGISEDLLARVTGKQGQQEWLVDTSDTARGEVNFTQASKLFKAVAGAELTFLFPRDEADVRKLQERLAGSSISHGEGLDQKSGSSRTTSSVDTSEEIMSLLERSSGGITKQDIIGELQFAFLTGMHLANLSCVDHWWHLVLDVILRAHALVVTKPGLCYALLQTLLLQLEYNDRFIVGRSSSDSTAHTGSKAEGSVQPDEGVGILEFSPQKAHRLREALTVYKRRLNDILLGLGDAITSEQGAVGHIFADVEALFWRHGWDLRSDYVNEMSINGVNGVGDNDDEDDDYEPVVVELDEHGREVGLIHLS